MSYANEKGIPLIESTSFKMITGKGILAEINDCLIICGNEKFLNDNKVLIDNKAQSILEKLRTQGKASILVAQNQKCIGVVALSDVLRPEVKKMVTQLLNMNTHTVLLTGDHLRTADYFAKQAEISDVHAELLPEDKVLNIEKLQKKGHQVCMIGDGINDAPALKTADVSVAMGNVGSDIAVDAADIVLMSGNIS